MRNSSPRSAIGWRRRAACTIGEREDGSWETSVMWAKTPSLWRGPGGFARPGSRPVGHGSSVVEVVRPGTRSQESVNHKIGDLAAQPLTGREVEPEMLSGKNPAQRRLLRGIAEGAER